MYTASLRGTATRIASELKVSRIERIEPPGATPIVVINFFYPSLETHSSPVSRFEGKSFASRTPFNVDRQNGSNSNTQPFFFFVQK